MKDMNAPDFLWADAFATVVYAINRTARSWSGSVTPFEAFFGEKPDVSHMQVWYADVFIHQPKGLGAGKLGECSHQRKFLGYPESSTGYKTYDPHTHKVQVAHAPIFREEVCCRWCKQDNSELGAQTALHFSVSRGVIQRKERGPVKCN